MPSALTPKKSLIPSPFGVKALGIYIVGLGVASAILDRLVNVVPANLYAVTRYFLLPLGLIV